MSTAILGEKTGVRNLPSMRTEGDLAFPRVLIIVDQCAQATNRQLRQMKSGTHTVTKADGY